MLEKSIAKHKLIIFYHLIIEMYKIRHKIAFLNILGFISVLSTPLASPQLVSQFLVSKVHSINTFSGLFCPSEFRSKLRWCFVV